MMVVEVDGYGALKAAIRRMCAEIFSQADPEEAVFEGKLVVSELVTNALRYGGGGATLAIEREGEAIRVCVRGKNAFRPPERSVCSDPSAERGRGLFLVDTLCASRMYSEEEGVCVVLHVGK